MSENALNAPASPAEMGALITSLRDLHDPAPISWWPLGPAWWALALLCIMFATWQLHRRYRKRAVIRLGNQIMRQAHSRWLVHQENSQYLSEVNITLRKIALTMKPRGDVAGLSGAQWSAMLNALSAHRLTEQSTQALSELAYRPNPDTSVEQLHTDLLRWIRKLKVSQLHA